MDNRLLKAIETEVDRIQREALQVEQELLSIILAGQPAVPAEMKRIRAKLDEIHSDSTRVISTMVASN